MPRHAAIDVDVDAITANTRSIRNAAPGAMVCAVVKADGYGHGSVPAARAALAGGATWLAVALVEEGHVLRSAGLDAPILVLSEPPPDVMPEAYAERLTPTLYTDAGVDAAIAAVGAAVTIDLDSTVPWSVHLKVDTGMHRVGAHPDQAVALARRVLESDELHLGGTFTHLAVADEPTRSETTQQLDLFDQVLGQLAAAGIDPGIRHAANSAGIIAHPRSHLDLVRAGIALYGLAPSTELAAAIELRPAMRVSAEVTLVKALVAGDGVSYGLRYVTDGPAQIAIVPLGYADGVDRRLGLVGGQVLIGGVRRPIRGVVTMDQLIVEVTDGPEVQVGDEVILLGGQGRDEVAAQEWADRLDTIVYEVVCGFSGRIPRRHGRRDV